VSINFSISYYLSRSQLFNSHISKSNRFAQALFLTLLRSLRGSYVIVIIIFCIASLLHINYWFLARILPCLLEILTIRSFWMTMGNWYLKWPGSCTRCLVTGSKRDSSIHNLILQRKTYLEISGIDNRSDSAIISTILAQLRSHGWLKLPENEKTCAFSMPSNSQMHK
jgi:hypothetical protein